LLVGAFDPLQPVSASAETAAIAAIEIASDFFTLLPFRFVNLNQASLTD
jgi:hypothetical protein